ncbi:autotransporter domain-containing protein [Gilvimarinus sp. F26214L]|uniref:autotransporter domain-containing protein n=1 Tax=Gilvimarinus sp. DZF01 TaxID=3461371 RepID=UPI0040457FEC
MYRLRRSLQVVTAPLLLTASLPLLAAEDSVQRIVVFGDSLSDSGFYSEALGLPAGSSFTTNPDPVAPEVFSTELGLPLSVAYGEGGSNYATGDARVLEENGASIPIVRQIDAFLGAHERFNKQDLVYIQGGGNDFFAFAGGGPSNVLTTAADRLADQVARVQAAGAERIVTMAVQTGGNAGLILFNERYEQALAARQVNALYFDTDALFNELVADAGAFGFTAILEPACGSVGSLTCTQADWVSPDANETHLLADDVHPAGKTQRIQGQAIASLVRAPEQIGQLVYGGQSLFRSHRDILEPAIRRGLGQEVGTSAVFADVGYQDFKTDGSAQIVRLEEDGAMVNLGVDHRAHEDTSYGIALTLSDGEGEFEHSQGDYNVDALSALFYVQGDANGLHLHADAMVGRARYENLTRSVQLGPVLREHESETDARFFSLGAGVGKTYPLGDGVALVPRMGAIFENLKVDGFHEDQALSTSARFSSQELHSLRGLAGIELNARIIDSLRIYVEAQFNYEFKDEERKLTLLPYGAPVSYRTELYQPERGYVRYDAGLEVQLSPGARLRAGVSGGDREHLERTAAFLGVSLQL